MRKRSFWHSLYILAFVLSATALPLSASAEIETVAEAINKAGRQRMLTQRIVRAYAQVGLGVKKTDSEKMLKNAVALFDVQFQELEDFALTAKLKKRVADVKELWGPFKGVALGPVNKAGAEKLLATNDELLAACHRLVLELQDFSGTPGGRLVNIAGRQRMLSQRLAKFYMLREWGFDSSALEDQMNKTSIEFSGGLAILTEAELNTPTLSRSLEYAHRMFKKYEESLSSTGERAREEVSRKADNILRYMNGVTAMYEDLAITSE